MVNFTAVYVLWLRELKRYVRAKSRVISSLILPVLFLVGLGFGFNKMIVPGTPVDVNYIIFIMPGVIGMGLMSSSVMSGISVLWDREFGFLKEIMIAPVDRFSIALGRIAGGMVTSMIQGLLIFVISLFLGLKISSVYTLLLALVIMALISATFVGLGLIFSSLMKDMQGFSSIMSLVIMPFLFLSGAFFPIDNLPVFIRVISYFDPLTYGVDGLRSVFINTSSMPLAVDIAVLLLISAVFLTIGTILFEKSESV